LLQLSPDKKITCAFGGLQKVSPEALKKLYGDPAVFTKFDPNTDFDLTSARPYIVFSGAYDIAKIPLLLHVNEGIRTGKIQVSYMDFARDLMEACFRQFSYFS
jgi:hypothetical protein